MRELSLVAQATCPHTVTSEHVNINARLTKANRTHAKTYSLIFHVDRLEHGRAGQLEHGCAGQLEYGC